MGHCDWTFASEKDRFYHDHKWGDALLKELLIENMNMQIADLSGDDTPAPFESFEKNISKIARRSEEKRRQEMPQSL